MLIFSPSLSNSLKTLTNSSDVSFVSPLNSSIQPLVPAMFAARKIKITFALNEDRPLLLSTSSTHAHQGLCAHRPIIFKFTSGRAKQVQWAKQTKTSKEEELSKITRLFIGLDLLMATVRISQKSGGDLCGKSIGYRQYGFWKDMLEKGKR